MTVSVHARDERFLPLPRSIRSFRAALWPAICLAISGCVTAVESAPPLSNPASVAARLGREASGDRPATLRFDWRYADVRGDVGGEGVGRYNPPDSLRVDLFTSGDVAMAVAVAGGELRSLGEIEDVRVPDLAFVYAMAGLFHPGDGSVEGYLVGADSVLVYGADSESRMYFFVRDGRLRRLEERRRGRTVQRVNLEWGDGDWPVEAEYRDLVERSRVRWQVGDVTVEEESHPRHVYDLPPIP